MEQELAQKIRKRALDLLARREHARSELIRKLVNKGFENSAVTEIVNELAEEDLQNDARYTEGYIRSRVCRGYGPIRIRQELRERDISEDISSELLQSAADWHELAYDARVKKFGNAIPEEFKERAKQMSFLQYRGFTHEQINASFR